MRYLDLRPTLKGGDKMVEYIKAVITKAFGVFTFSLVCTLSTLSFDQFGVVNAGDAVGVAAAATLATVLWPAAPKLSAKWQSTKIPDINSPPGGGGARLP